MREALARLAAEGFVEQRAQRGMRVPELNFEELQDLSTTRQIVGVSPTSAFLRSDLDFMRLGGRVQ